MLVVLAIALLIAGMPLAYWVLMAQTKRWRLLGALPLPAACLAIVAILAAWPWQWWLAVYTASPQCRGFLRPDRATLGTALAPALKARLVPLSMASWSCPDTWPSRACCQDCCKVVSFQPNSPIATEVASGGRLLVDVEFARGHTLYALAQGIWPLGNAEGSPALPNTGSLLRVNADGTFTHVADGLNQPTSLEFIGDTAYVVSLPGEIWKIDNVSGPHAG